MSRLFFRVWTDLKNTDWPKIEERQQERSLTRTNIVPRLHESVSNIGDSRILVRGDGHVAVNPIYRFGTSFTPDMDVKFHQQKCMAFEIKIIRNSDPSGALTKAIGQAVAYKNLGYEHAILMIFEGRGRRNSDLAKLLNEDISLPLGVHAHYFN